MSWTIDHIGWITGDIALFESFWCDLLGYELCLTTTAPAEQMEALFGYGEGSLVRRYTHPTLGPDIEIHHVRAEGEIPFIRPGMNHICLHLGKKGSRQALLEKLPLDVERRIYDNPKGWQTIFIRDYEGNWVELREAL